jgi:hypothetical protein
MDFTKLFESVNWQPVEYKNRMIQIADSLPYNITDLEYHIEFVEVNSNWEQGIFFQSKGAHFLINNEVEKLNSCWLWNSEFPRLNTLKLLKEGKNDLKVWNIWRIDKGPMNYGHNGAAIYIENLPNRRKYFCNDGYPDNDFNDLIFTITWENQL